MKKNPFKKHYSSMINVVIFITIICMPFYAYRFFITPTISVSMLSIGCTLLVSCLFFLYHTHALTFFKSDVLWSFALLFVFAFIPSLFFHPNIHAWGVFIEWIILPTLCAFFLALHIQHSAHNQRIVIMSLICTLCMTIIISLTYLFLNILTFDYRLQAFYASPNHLALYIAPLLWISCIFIMHHNFFVRISTYFMLCSGMVVLFFTQSLNTMLALLCSFVITIFVFVKHKKSLFTFFLCIFLCIIFFGTSKLLLENSDLKHNSFSSRIVIWDTTIYLLQKNMLIGHELDSFQAHYLTTQEHFDPYPDWAVPTPHDLPATILFSGGILALLCFLLLCMRICYRFFITISLDPTKKHLVYIGAAFVTMILCGIGDTPFWKNDLSVLFWLLLVLVYVHTHNHITTEQNIIMP